MKKQIERYKYLIIIFSIIGLALIIFLSQKKEDKKPQENFDLTKISQEPSQETKPKAEEVHSSIFVDVKGQVVNPGIYEAKTGERVQDLINRAGGFLKDGDKNQVNLAQKVHDEMVIYVPKFGEDSNTSTTITTDETSSSNNEKKLNINKANSEQLQTIPGIGPSKANAIIEYRDQNGMFKQIEDIKNITGIGDKTFEKLKSSIAVE